MQYSSDDDSNTDSSEDNSDNSDNSDSDSCACTKKVGRKHLTIHSKSTHAEEMAIDKLIKIARKTRRSTRKIIDVSLIVIRMNSKGTPDNYHLGNSKPCSNCVHKIEKLTSYGYRINRIYYSNDDGMISVSNVNKLLADTTVRPSSFYRNTNMPKYLKNNHS